MTTTDDANLEQITLIGGMAHDMEVSVETTQQTYTVPVGEQRAVYARNEKGRPEFIFSGYTNGLA